MLKLNSRLAAIHAAIPEGYNTIWDCCCDHGYLGMKILADSLCDTVCFVDQVASITDKLEKKLIIYQASNYQVITASAASLTLDKTKKHLIILAGVSGNTVIDIMQGLHALNPGQEIDFILSPNYQIVEVRQYLIHRQLNLLYETLIIENGQAYEVIHVASTQLLKEQLKDNLKERLTEPNRLTLSGNFWIKHDVQHIGYLDKLLSHYRNKLNKETDNSSVNILNTYEQLKTYLTSADQTDY